MIPISSNRVKPVTLAALLLTFFSFSAMAGRDYYEISLNNKLIQRQFIGEATTGLMELQLDKSNYNDNLVITYFHCHIKGPAKGRNVVVKNAQNEVVREWKFADATGSDMSMSIPVKDILALQKNNPNTTLTLYYFSAQELPKGQMLASFKLGDKSVTRLRQPEAYLPSIHPWLFVWMKNRKVDMSSLTSRSLQA